MKPLYTKPGFNFTIYRILTTHHHWDHAGGNSDLLKKLGKDIECYGGSKQVKSVSHIVKDNETIKLGDISIQALTTGGHTMDHICYYVDYKGERAVFTGDCLFSSGCGRFFEGTPSDMWNALSKLLKLPEDTKVYFGHEYTVSNLKFAESVEKDNKDIAEKMKWAKEVGVTTPSTIKNEKLTNPFMRVELPEVAKLIVDNPHSASVTDVLGKLRQMKDNF